MSNLVVLSWPPKPLWPNRRAQHRYSGAERKAYKQAAWALAKSAKLQPASHLEITFLPPNRIKRDLDNMLAAVKYGLDGIAEAIGQDDSEWSITIQRGEPATGGGVIVKLVEAVNG